MKCYSKNYCCMDCGGLISNQTVIYGLGRCRKCASLNRKNKPRGGKLRFGKDAPNYKDGRCLKYLNCIECNKKLKNKYAQRCIKCSANNKEHIKKQLKSRRNYKGKKNPNWQEGISKLPYPFKFNIKLKRKIHKRDNNICQKCFMTNKEHEKRWNYKLTVHHIDYNKENCEESNLITLCHPCNTRANGNRDYWFAYYTYLTENR